LLCRAGVWPGWPVSGDALNDQTTKVCKTIAWDRPKDQFCSEMAGSHGKGVFKARLTTSRFLDVNVS